jgi:hypothetical protein
LNGAVFRNGKTIVSLAAQIAGMNCYDFEDHHRKLRHQVEVLNTIIDDKSAFSMGMAVGTIDSIGILKWHCAAEAVPAACGDKSGYPNARKCHHITF